MTTLQQAEAHLRDLAGYRGQPSSENALTGEECLLIAEELTALRLKVSTLEAFAAAPPPEGSE